jgi:O-antigen ligase
MKLSRLAGRALPLSWRIAWGALLVSLPVTSFPPLSKLAGGAQVAPLALIPLGWLVLTWMPHALLRRDASLPGETRPLFGFLLAALVSALAALFLDIPAFKSHTPIENSAQAVLTLAAGAGFYFASLSFIRVGGFRQALRWISIGGMLLLAWSLAQSAVIWLGGNEYPGWMLSLHGVFATSSLLRLEPLLRVTGFAYEPSWLAHMLNLLYLPLWLAASVGRDSAFRLRLGKLIVEDFLLSAGLMVFLLSFARLSLLALMLALGWLVFLGVRRLTASAFRGARVLRRALSLLMLIACALLFLGIVFGMALLDPRLEPVFQVGEQVASGEWFDGGVLMLAHRLNFAERAVYWEMGWRVFESHPLLGVGLGNSGAFALQEMSHWAWEFVEVRRILFVESFVPNIKNLWIRLLAETGVVGTAFFVTWLMLQWRASRALRADRQALMRTLGLAGQLSLIALLVEGFSVDSFALPYAWVALGILTAASASLRGGGMSTGEPSTDPDGKV